MRSFRKKIQCAVLNQGISYVLSLLSSLLTLHSQLTVELYVEVSYFQFCRDGLQSMDLQVGKWLRRHAPGIKIVLVMNKSESLDESDGSLAAAAGEAYRLGFGDPIAISAETGLGMAELYDALKPLLEEHMVQVLNGM